MKLVLAVVITILVSLFSVTSCTAQTLSIKDIDARIENQLYEVVKLGTDVYNRGGHDACYRLYQGSLISVAGFLDHRPELSSRIQKTLKDTDNMTSARDRAFSLRTAIDEVRTAIKTTYKPDANPPDKSASTANPVKPAPAAKKTLWDRLGGELTVTLITEDLINRSLLNPRVNLTRKGTGHAWEPNPENISKLKKQFLNMFSVLTGGPLKYEGKNMKELHSKMKISDSEFDAMIADLHSTLQKFFVDPSEREELIRLVSSTKKDIVDPALMTKSLWSRLGGEPMVALIIDDFVSRAMRNPAVNFSRKNSGKEWRGSPVEINYLKRRILLYVSSITDGPHPYDGKSMKEVHAGMKITEAEFKALADDLKASLDLMKIASPEQAELLKLVNGIKKDVVEN